MEQQLRKSETYHNAVNEADKKLDEVLEGMSSEQESAIDSAMSAYNYSNSEYSKESY